MSKLVPKYTVWEAVNAALAVGMRALEEVRTLSRNPGKDGERGAEGPAGKLPVVREWVDKIHYQSDVVSHAGATFQALCDTAREPPHDDWQCIASAGQSGTDGRSFEVLGTYDPAKQYQKLSVVALNGASFSAKRDNPGPCPGEGWQLMATQGKQGKPGERGERGLKGDAGPPVVGLSISKDAVLTLTNGDGSTVDLDLYPLLSSLR